MSKADVAQVVLDEAAGMPRTCARPGSVRHTVTASETLLPGSVAAWRTRSLQTTGYDLAFVTLGLIAASLGATLPGLIEQTSSSFLRSVVSSTARSFGYLTGSFSGRRLTTGSSATG